MPAGATGQLKNVWNRGSETASRIGEAFSLARGPTQSLGGGN
jgi:hypothetical protein